MKPDARSIIVVIGKTDDDTRDEAFRAALGLTLRGARVDVVIVDPHATSGTEARRARATLEMMGHTVRDAPARATDAGSELAKALEHADAVEVWGDAGGHDADTRRRPAVATDATPTPVVIASAPVGGTAHLVRPGRRVAVAAPTGAVLHLPPVLERDDADRLLDQLLAADRVVVW